MSKVSMLRVVVVILAMLLLAVSPIANLAQPASAAGETNLYVSPAGTGTDCSTSSPCQLTAAQTKVQGLAPQMQSDIVVNLTDGTYSLSSSLTLTSADSGKNGHEVIYRGTPGKAFVSGGKEITGWTVKDSTKKIYQAPLNGLDTRQLWVNGKKAELASGDVASIFGSPSLTSTGFTFTNSAPNSWINPATSNFVFFDRTHGWTYMKCMTNSISGNKVTIQSPCMENATHNNTQIYGSLATTPQTVENNYALLNEPGQFVVDSIAGYVYYIPRSGEDMSKVTAIAGARQNLLNFAGTASSPVQNLKVTGITFEHTTWLMGNLGAPEIFANVLLGNDWSADARALPAAIQCSVCKHVTFEGNVFRHLGGSGLNFDGGGSDDSVTGNVITEVAGNGIQVGQMASGPSGSQDNLIKEPSIHESNDVISNNYIYDIANEYLGGVGILGNWSTNLTISHNEVWDTPYIGIAVWGGWGIVGPDAPTTRVNNHIDYNYVHDVMTSQVFDGAGIYVNGRQATNAGSTMKGNYVANSSRIFASIYLDNGSSYWSVKDNVVGGYGANWINISNSFHKADYNTVENNYVGADAGGYQTPWTPTNTVQNNQLGLTSWPLAAQQTMAQAGLESQYEGQRGGLSQTNLAYGKSATASSSWSSSYGPAKAVSGSIGSTANLPTSAYGQPWASAATDNSAFIQVDLGARSSLSIVQLLLRVDYNDPATRNNFQVLVSNTPGLAGATVACTRGSGQLPFGDRYDCAVPAGTWRYVLVHKTDSAQFGLSQLRAFGYPPHGTASQSSDYTQSGSPTADKAIDGNTSGDYSAGSVTATNSEANAWWKEDLLGAVDITSLKIYNRTDCCSDRLSDYWVFASNTPFNTALTPSQQSQQAGVWSSHQTSAPNPSTTVNVGGTYRYIMIQLAGTNTLSLAEVVTNGSYVETSPPTASQSSTYTDSGSPTAGKAVDGNTDGVYSAGSVTATNSEANAWWKADLHTSRAITSLKIYNRTDCCSERLADYWVFASNTPFDTALTPSQQSQQAGVWSSHQTSAPNPSTTVNVGGAYRYIMIQLAGTNTLSLAEVTVT
ncbi:galactose-binding domain-containing protein [Streptomyces tubercidicus]